MGKIIRKICKLIIADNIERMLIATKFSWILEREMIGAN